MGEQGEEGERSKREKGEQREKREVEIEKRREYRAKNVYKNDIEKGEDKGGRENKGNRVRGVNGRRESKDKRKGG